MQATTMDTIFPRRLADDNRRALLCKIEKHAAEQMLLKSERKRQKRMWADRARLRREDTAEDNYQKLWDDHEQIIENRRHLNRAKATDRTVTRAVWEERERDRDERERIRDNESFDDRKAEYLMWIELQEIIRKDEVDRENRREAREQRAIQRVAGIIRRDAEKERDTSEQLGAELYGSKSAENIASQERVVVFLAQREIERAQRNNKGKKKQTKR